MKIFLEKRGGKTITVVKGLHTYGSSRLEAIASEVKNRLGCGGTVKSGLIEIQGDKRVQAKELLAEIITRKK